MNDRFRSGVSVLALAAGILAASVAWAAGQVTGKYIGNGKEAKLAHAVVIPHEPWEGEKAYTIILSEKDPAGVEKPESDAMFGKLGDALVVAVTAKGDIFSTQVCHQSLKRSGFGNTGSLFVDGFFELTTNPAIFMYVDTKDDPAKLENTLAHELHHVGVAGCPAPPGVDKLPAVNQRVIRELGGFNEGLAVLAAAGSPDVHPHATSGPDAWLVWERDVARFNADLPRIEAFFRDVLAGRLSEEEENKRLFLFINAGDVPQGAFYTVGWKMAAMIERARGREALVKLVCDPRAMLAAYNEIAAAHPRSDGAGLALWSPEFLTALSGANPR